MTLVVRTSYAKTELDRKGSFWTCTYQPITLLPAPDWQPLQPRQRLWHPRTVPHLLLCCSTRWHLLVPLTQNYTHAKETRASLWEWELAWLLCSHQNPEVQEMAHLLCNYLHYLRTSQKCSIFFSLLKVKKNKGTLPGAGLVECHIGQRQDVCSENLQQKETPFILDSHRIKHIHFNFKQMVTCNMFLDICGNGQDPIAKQTRNKIAVCLW